MRRTPDPNQSLRHLPGLEDASDAELARVSALVDECAVPAGTVLVREGTCGRDSFVIVEGSASVSVGGQLVAVLGPGDHVGEMALLDPAPRSATVVATTGLRVLVIGPAAIGTFFDQPHVVRAVAAGLARRIRATDAASAPVHASLA